MVEKRPLWFLVKTFMGDGGSEAWMQERRVSQGVGPSKRLTRKNWTRPDRRRKAKLQRVARRKNRAIR